MRPPIPWSIKVELWEGPLTTDPTFEPTHRYVEAFWLPVIGPTAIMLARKLYVKGNAGPYVAEIDTLALELGLVLEDGGPRPALVQKSLVRLQVFRLARFDGATYSLRSRWPLLNEAQVARLPEHLRKLARPPVKAAS